MNKREVMKVENLVRNYKMVYSDRQGEEEIKVLKGLDFTIEEQDNTFKSAWLDRQTDFREDFLYGKGCVRIME